MTDTPDITASTQTIERIIPAPRTRIWELWTTAHGIPQWWSPDGFRTEVDEIDLRPGGNLVHTMTAETPEMVEFMEQNGMPLATTSRKVFTEVDAPARVAYQSIIDFVPDHEPYEHLTEVDLEEVDGGTKVTMRVEPMHDDVWNERLLAGRTNELDNLAKLCT